MQGLNSRLPKKTQLMDKISAVSFVVNPLQFRNYLAHGVSSIAALDNFEARPVQSERFFRHQQNPRLLLRVVQPASCRQTWAAI
jgi:hypothetical protein